MNATRKCKGSLAWLGIVAGVLLPAAMAAPAAFAHSDKKSGLEVIHAWTFATSDAGGTVRVFMKIKNLTGAPERLVGASTVAAAAVELREPAAAGDDAPSKPTAAVSVDPGRDAELTRNGPHLVLTGIKMRLNAYDSFKLTLIFEKLGRMVVDVMIEEAEEAHKH